MTNGHEDNGLLITSIQETITNEQGHVFSTATINDGNKIDILQNIKKVVEFDFEYFLPVLKVLNDDIKEHLTEDGGYGYICKYNKNFISLIFQSSASDFINKFKSVDEIFAQDEEWKSFKKIQNLQQSNNIDFTIWSRGNIFNISENEVVSKKLSSNYSSTTLIINLR